MEETFLCLPLDLTMGRDVDGSGGAGIGSGVGAVMLLKIRGDYCADVICGGAGLSGTAIPV